MNFSTLTFLLCMFGAANAHFRLNYPGPRGAFVADREPLYCGGYTDVTTNRTTFPLSGGFFKIETGHPDWSASVILSTAENPNSFDLFSVDGQEQIVSPWGNEHDAGSFCIPLNISAANIEGVRDGSNVTIQVVFNGGDGALYQCADLTLSAELTQPSDVTCTNATTPHNHGSDDAQSGAMTVHHGLAAYTAVGCGIMGLLAALFNTFMRLSVAVLLPCLATVVTAHFQLQFPPPRGPFVEDNEKNFCDDYTEVTTNRTVFPLSGGFFTLNSEHPQWTGENTCISTPVKSLIALLSEIAAVQIATTPDPNTFDDFKVVNNFFQVNGEGLFCIPLDFKSSNATGLTNNQNVTIQIVYAGGDGNLYQCADLTLSDSAKISSDIACTNGTSSSSSTGTSATTSGNTSPSQPSSALPVISSPIFGVLCALSAIALVVI
ncbi:hypothetical protein CVT25_014954 [Psilocybe cyanescens]|uniref:Copper acquisition factor BIM1-like domain-containing protein n=1 Tax=Psilocybe cyanescens TaxID=93625 RepID=A0A409XI59_PSICY|nr:hypothetical protein CVT25_014954 [Psilocybe cyanescens]